MTPEAIDTIIAAVGKEPRDRAKLAVQLDRLQRFICVNRKTWRPKLIGVRKEIEKLAKMVDSNPLAKSLQPAVAAILAQARRLETTSKHRRLSFTEYVCGELLVSVFNMQFGKATTTRNGSYVKFAEAALKILGESCERETIVRSMTKVKKVMFVTVNPRGGLRLSFRGADGQKLTWNLPMGKN